MEPENHPFAKENHLPNLLCSMLIFRGVHVTFYLDVISKAISYQYTFELLDLFMHKYTYYLTSVDTSVY